MPKTPTADRAEKSVGGPRLGASCPAGLRPVGQASASSAGRSQGCVERLRGQPWYRRQGRPNSTAQGGSAWGISSASPTAPQSGNYSNEDDLVVPLAGFLSGRVASSVITNVTQRRPAPRFEKQELKKRPIATRSRHGISTMRSCCQRGNSSRTWKRHWTA